MPSPFSFSLFAVSALSSPAASCPCFSHSPTDTMSPRPWWNAAAQRASCQVFDPNNKKCNKSNSIFCKDNHIHLENKTQSSFVSGGSSFQIPPFNKIFNVIDYPSKRLAVADIYQAWLAFLLFSCTKLVHGAIFRKD